MWFRGWVWFKGLRSERQRPSDDRADMGVEIGLDASIDSMLPPLLDFAADKSQRHSTAAVAAPLGTDLRSYHRTIG